MRNYIIDVEKEYIKSAMHALGIEPKELERKSIEEFYDRNISEEVQQLRYDYYNRVLNETVKRIRAYLKEQIQKGHSAFSKFDVKASYDESTQDKSKGDELEEIKRKNRELIINTISEMDSQVKGLQAIEKKLKIVADTKQEILKNKQKEASRKIQKDRDASYEANNTRTSLKSHGYKKNYEEGDRARTSSVKLRKNDDKRAYKEKLDTEFLSTIDDKLSKINQKLSKSRDKYRQNIKQKKEVASRIGEKAEIIMKTVERSIEEESSELASKIFTKHRESQIRRKEYMQNLIEKRNDEKKKKEERLLKAKEKLKEGEELEIKKAAAIEKRMDYSMKLIEKKQENWNKEFEIRSELQKLRDDEAILNAERQKRALKARRDHVLERHMQDKIRIEAIRQEKEQELKRKQDLAFKAMIEKEKAFEAVAAIRKSPDSKLAKDLMRQFNVSPAKATPVAEQDNLKKIATL